MAANMHRAASRWGWILCFNRRSRLCRVALLLWLSLALRNVQAMELAVIVHPTNKVVLSHEQLQLVLLNKQRYFDGVQKIRMLHQPSRSKAHQWLCRQLLDLTPAQYQSYWSRLLFTGNADGLVYLDTAAILQQVSTDPSAIGYVPLEQVTDRIKVMAVLNEHGYQTR